MIFPFRAVSRKRKDPRRSWNSSNRGCRTKAFPSVRSARRARAAQSRTLSMPFLQRLREDGCDGVCLWVLGGNRQAQAFYRHMGFHASGRSQKELFGGAEVELVEMLLRWER